MNTVQVFARKICAERRLANTEQKQSPVNSFVRKPKVKQDTKTG